MNPEDTRLAALAFQQEKEQRLLQTERDKKGGSFFEGKPPESTEEERDWLTTQKYEHVQAGTYVSPEKGTYYYHKRGFEVRDSKQADLALQLIRSLTEKGFFPPGIQWDSIGREKNDPRRTIVAQMPALEIIPLEILKLPAHERPEPWNTFIDAAEHGRHNLNQGSKIDYVFDVSDNPDSHIGKWMASLGAVPGGNPELGMNAILELVTNWGEIGEFDNWGYDITSKRFYPIDIEAINRAISQIDDIESLLERLKNTNA